MCTELLNFADLLDMGAQDLPESLSFEYFEVGVWDEPDEPRSPVTCTPQQEVLPFLE